MEKRSERLYTAQQIRSLEKHFASAMGISMLQMMSRAGAAAFAELKACWPTAQRILVICGPGRNGGDGYVLARIAKEQHMDVDVVSLSPVSKLKGDTRRVYEDFLRIGGKVEETLASRGRSHDVVVDAIFGIGLGRSLEGVYKEAVRRLSVSKTPVMAIDLPTGLMADSGAINEVCLPATLTVTFIGLKAGLYTGHGPAYAGKVALASLDAPHDVFDEVDNVARLLTGRRVARVLKPRQRDAHKGLHGHVLVVGGGSTSYPGAVLLTAEAALRAGAGKVTVAMNPAFITSVVARCPEVVAVPISRPSDIEGLLNQVDVVAIGPGLREDTWAEAMVRAVWPSRIPAVVDADALNCLARMPRKRRNWVLTPHPGEAARLLPDYEDIDEIQQDRLGAAETMSDRYGGVVVLKGAGTVVDDGRNIPWVCDRGNPGLATAGMGDVLTGLIAGILGQYGNCLDAAKIGVWIHATAADELAEDQGERGLMATDLLPYIQAKVNPSHFTELDKL
ncbi:MAG: NAD(P)H-hydrate dehydratase [Gammaproteobacteria bacterium]|nr:NAD(P)H-hydrate dehydratase [Gammaproteobacteria bacterium]